MQVAVAVLLSEKPGFTKTVKLNVWFFFERVQARAAEQTQTSSIAFAIALSARVSCGSVMQ